MTAKPRRRIVQVFGRPPVPGRTKTRLIPALGAHRAAAVAARLLQRTLQTVSCLDGPGRELWLSEPSGDGKLETGAEDLGFRVHRQQGEDLGERMANALAGALSRADAVVLIGSDCPQVDGDYLAGAFAALERHPVVIGPAIDGGYVLIGVTRVSPPLLRHLFRDIPWGSASVLRHTHTRLRETGWTWHELAALRDIDDGDDLARFPQLLSHNDGRPSPPGA